MVPLSSASLRQHHGVPVPPVPTPAPKGPSKTSLWTRIKADVTKVKTKVEANIAKSGQKVGQFAIQTGDDVLNLKNSIVQQSQKQGSVTFSSTNCSVQNKCPLAIVKNFQGEDITKQVHAAFQDGKFTQEHFKTDITLYRCTGGGWDERKGAGNWWSPTIPTSSAESMSRLAISKVGK